MVQNNDQAGQIVLRSRRVRKVVQNFEAAAQQLYHTGKLIHNKRIVGTTKYSELPNTELVRYSKGPKMERSV